MTTSVSTFLSRLVEGGADVIDMVLKDVKE
jgi:hypothetical protein